MSVTSSYSSLTAEVISAEVDYLVLKTYIYLVFIPTLLNAKLILNGVMLKSS